MFDLEIISAFLGGNVTSEDNTIATYEDKRQTVYGAGDPGYGYLGLQNTNDCVHAANFESFIGPDGITDVNNKDVHLSYSSPETRNNSTLDSENGYDTVGEHYADSQTSDDSWVYGYYYRDSEARQEYGHSPDRQGEHPDTGHCSNVSRMASCDESMGSLNSSTDKDTHDTKKLPTYVRLGATIRERTRMHMLNDAFEELRKVVPRHNVGDHQKLSKIATLRNAIQYIAALASTLETSGVKVEQVKGYCVGDRRGKRRNTRKKFHL